MIWLVGAINKHIVYDVEGNWIGTFKDEEIAAEVVNAHNNGSVIPITTLDAKLAASNGWTNSTKGWSR
jgi:hypothetical protein